MLTTQLSCSLTDVRRHLRLRELHQACKPGEPDAVGGEPPCQTLEDQVGQRLIVRNARRLRLTEQGEVLQSYPRRILALYEEAEQHLGRDSGSLRIGMPPGRA